MLSSRRSVALWARAHVVGVDPLAVARHRGARAAAALLARPPKVVVERVVGVEDVLHAALALPLVLGARLGEAVLGAGHAPLELRVHRGGDEVAEARRRGPRRGLGWAA